MKTSVITPGTRSTKKLPGGKTVALVVEHRLRGVTPEMIDWWWDNIDNDSYRLWHPRDHIAFEWQVPPTETGHVGAIHMACESLTFCTTHNDSFVVYQLTVCRQ